MSDCFPVVKNVLPAIAIAIDVQHSTVKQSDGIFTITVTPRNAARVQICGGVSTAFRVPELGQSGVTCR